MPKNGVGPPVRVEEEGILILVCFLFGSPIFLFENYSLFYRLEGHEYLEKLHSTKHDSEGLKGGI